MHNDESGIVTRSGGRRLRWLAAAVAVPIFGVVAAFATVARVPEPVPVRTVVETLALSATPVGDSGTIIYFQEDRFRRNDTLATLITRLGADGEEAATLLRSSRAARPFHLLLPGTTVQAKVDEVGRLRSISFLTDEDTLLSADRLGDGFGRDFGQHCGPTCGHLWRRRGFSSRSAPWGPFWGRFRNLSPRRQNDPIRAGARGRILPSEENIPRRMVSGSLGKGRLLHPGRREPAQGIPALA